MTNGPEHKLSNAECIKILEISGEFLTVSEIFDHYIKKFPGILENKKQPSNGRTIESQLKSEIGSRLYKSLKKEKLLFVTDKLIGNNTKKAYGYGEQFVGNENDIENDIKEDKYERRVIEENGEDKLSPLERATYDRFWDISSDLKKYCNILFEVDHAKSLKECREDAVKPNNLQLLPKIANKRKGGKSIERISYETQVEIIISAIKSEFLYEGQEVVDEKIEMFYKIIAPTLKSLFGE